MTYRGIEITNAYRLKRREWFAALYTSILVILSVVLFMMHRVNSEIGDFIKEQNTAALKLWENLAYYHDNPPLDNRVYPPPGFMEDVVNFSRTNANLINTAQRSQLLHLTKLQAMQLQLQEVAAKIMQSPPDVKSLVISPDISLPKLITAARNQIQIFQAVRDILQNEYKFHRVCFSAVRKYILPILYAVLGAWLYTCRRMCHAELKQPYAAAEFLLNRSRFLMERFLMAIIAGITISVFPFPEESVLSPIGIAFLTGYSIEILTSYLDHTVTKFTKQTDETQAEAVEGAK